MIRKGIVLFILLICLQHSAQALEVTTSPSVIYCDTTTVTFTFVDCAFDGEVLLGTNAPTGINFIHLPQTNLPFLDVSNGELSFDIDVSVFNTTGSFDIEFVVLYSNMDTCADFSEVAIATVNHNCVPPSNANCAGAIDLPISTDVCSIANYGTLNNTASGVDPSCDFDEWVDLWYSFTANNTDITLEMGGAPGFLAVYTLFEATNGCSSLGSEIDCGNITFFNGPNSKLFENLVDGGSYYLQLSYNSFENGNEQTLCLHSSTPQVPSCPSEINLTGEVNGMIDTESLDWISSEQTLKPNALVEYDALDSIVLMPNFEVELGAVFQAIIDGCGGL